MWQPEQAPRVSTETSVNASALPVKIEKISKRPATTAITYLRDRSISSGSVNSPHIRSVTPVPSAKAETPTICKGAGDTERANFSKPEATTSPVSYTHLRAHETDSYLVCRLLLEKKKKTKKQNNK